MIAIPVISCNKNYTLFNIKEHFLKVMSSEDYNIYIKSTHWGKMFIYSICNNFEKCLYLDIIFCEVVLVLIIYIAQSMWH